MIAIKVKKVINDSHELCWQIVDVKMLNKYQLTKEYLRGECCYRMTPVKGVTDSVLAYRTIDGIFSYYSKDWKITNTEFQRLLKRIRRCGERLRNMTKQRKQMESTWTGIETFKI